MPADPNPLTPEERSLAQRLARLGPHGEPSPALDARILATAHDAIARAPARRPRRRWPVALGIAASLVLAIGIAWQLRPLPGAVAAYQAEAPSAAPVASTNAPAADAMAGSAAMRADATTVASESKMPTPEAAAADSAETTPARATDARQAKSAAPLAASPVPPPPESAESRAEPDVVFDRATATPAPASQSAVASQAPRAFGTTPIQAPPAAPKTSDARNAPPESAADAANKAEAGLPQTDTLDRLQASGAQNADAGAGDEPGADVPPATMASPMVRDAWLARIRELVADGKPDAARASLHEFIRRYPDYALPDDLRALGQ